jgi:L-iditol 2-dehydrogenase
MRAVILRDGRISIEDFEIPKANYGEIVVKMRACGICGTDLEKLKGVHITPPVLGHEVVGDVFELGEGVKDIREGDKVFVHHHVSCGKCYYCLREQYTLCDLFPKTNLEPCGFSEYFKVPKINVERGAVVKLPDELSYEEATFIEPLACCIRSLYKLNIKPDDVACIIGSGPMGLLLLQMLKLMGLSEIVVSDIVNFRLNYARNFGALISKPDGLLSKVREVSGRLADLVIVATGNPKAIEQGFEVVRKGGIVNIFGSPYKGCKISIDMSRLFVNEIKVIPSYSTSEAETHRAVKLLREKKVIVKDLITHKFRLRDINKAFEVASDVNKALKVIVKD